VQGIYGHDFAIAEALSLRIGQLIEDRRERGVPVLVVHTGDLTAHGTDKEFFVGSRFLTSRVHMPGTGARVGLDLARDELLDIPGNHDLWISTPARYAGPYPRIWKRVIEGIPVVAYGLNSNHAPVIDKYVEANGEIDEGQLNEACRGLGGHPDPALRLVALPSSFV
jgi:hypothetical protein